jgi:hypothetical protein
MRLANATRPTTPKIHATRAVVRVRADLRLLLRTLMFPSQRVADCDTLKNDSF